MRKGLTPNIEAIIDNVSQLECIKPYTLCGGTALAIQLGHRMSEDLDFMLWRITLIQIEDPDKREYYELESVNNAWTARETERQINSMLYERLLMSNDKESVLAVARKQRIPEEPTIGILLCTQKNDTLVRMTLPEDNKTILASEYRLYLPTTEQLVKEIDTVKKLAKQKRKEQD